MRLEADATTSTVAWMISGGRRFDETWAEGARHRAAIEEARAARPSRIASVSDRIREAISREPEPKPNCCPA